MKSIWSSASYAIIASLLDITQLSICWLLKKNKPHDPSLLLLINCPFRSHNASFILLFQLLPWVAFTFNLMQRIRRVSCEDTPSCWSWVRMVHGSLLCMLHPPRKSPVILRLSIVVSGIGPSTWPTLYRIILREVHYRKTRLRDSFVILFGWEES